MVYAEECYATQSPVRERVGRPRSAGGASRSAVRPLRSGDIPQVVDLFAQTFRSGRPARIQAVEACLKQTYLTSPSDRIAPASLVDVGEDGRVRGFMGIITLTARFRGETLRGGVLGNFMALDHDRAKSAMRLIRATLTHDLDFIFSDTANQTSLAIARATKFTMLPLHSLEWVKVFRPCETGAALLGRRMARLGAAIRPIARAGDLVGRRLSLAAMAPPDRESGCDRAIDAATFVAKAPALIERFALGPGWDADELSWLLEQAGHKTRHGTLNIREVLDSAGRLAGLYLLYARAGDVAHALQVISARNREAIVVDAVLRHASELGAVAVRGASNPALVNGLTSQTGIFYHHVAATVVFTRGAALQAAFRSDEAFLGGLFGETWTRLMGDDFS
jgi:hypothetical protein